MLVAAALLVVGAPGALVVFPAAGSDDLAPQREVAAHAIVDTARGVAKRPIVSIEQVRLQYGFDLAAEARRCASDRGCLGRFAALVEAKAFITFSLSPIEGDTRVELILELVQAADPSSQQKLRWTTDADTTAVRRAAAAAARRLLSAPDAELSLTVLPPDARVRLFGQDLSASTSPQPCWSGVYEVIVDRPGYLRLQNWITITPGRVARVNLRLRPVVDELESERTPASASWRPTAGWVALGAGLATLGGSGVSYGVARSAIDDGNAAYARFAEASGMERVALQADIEDRDSQAKLHRGLSYGLAATSAILIGTGVYLLVSSPSRAPEASTAISRSAAFAW